MSLIGKEVADFTAQAYVKEDFKTVTKEDIKGKSIQLIIMNV